MSNINQLNWTFCQYIKEQYRCLVHLGGESKEDGSFQELYFVNILKTDEPENPNMLQEVEQFTFPELDSALHFINTKFSHWKFDNQLEKSAPASGCGSCVAH